jgi:hypothetical protein
MGFKYANITLQTIDQQGVALYLNTMQRNAFVLPATKGFVIVCDEESDTLDPRVISNLTIQLSRRFESVSIAVINFDDDILWYQLYKNGDLLDEYNSNPDYFELTEHRGPIGGDAKILCEIFHKPRSFGKVGEILHATPGEGYIYENDRHSDLAKALGWFTPYIRLSYGELAKEYLYGEDDVSLFAIPLSRRWLKQFTEADFISYPFDLDKEILKLLRQKKKISAIILCQQHKMCSLVEARNYVDELEKHGKKLTK